MGEKTGGTGPSAEDYAAMQRRLNRLIALTGKSNADEAEEFLRGMTAKPPPEAQPDLDIDFPVPEDPQFRDEFGALDARRWKRAAAEAIRKAVAHLTVEQQRAVEREALQKALASMPEHLRNASDVLEAAILAKARKNRPAAAPEDVASAAKALLDVFEAHASARVAAVDARAEAARAGAPVPPPAPAPEPPVSQPKQPQGPEPGPSDLEGIALAALAARERQGR